MAYLVFTAKGHELGRRPLNGLVTVGRSPECDISVRDILLSRRHCQIEPSPSGWIVKDLGSKNGTLISGQAVTQQLLHDGDTVEIGQTKVTFRAGTLAGQSVDLKQPLGSRRPSDPWEALSGTVSGFDYAKSRIDVQRVGRKPTRPLSMFPKPQPTPSDPNSYAQEDLYGMLTEIASSSWDSIYDNASRRTVKRSLPRPVIHPLQRPVATPHRDLLEQTTKRLLRQADQVNRRQRIERGLARVLRGMSVVTQWVTLRSPAWGRK